MKNVAVMGLGYISKRVCEGVKFASNANLYAVASRDINKAKEFQKMFNTTCCYGSYEEMVLDKNIDLVYICTPNKTHIEHIKLCMDHGKHVICEKPLCSNSEEVKELFAYGRSKNCFLLEAEKTLFTPLNTLLKQKVKEGIIGKVRMIDASYCGKLSFASYCPDLWNFNSQYGGSLYDVGVYPLCFSNYYADSKIKSYHVEKVNNHNLPVDFYGIISIRYENDILATLRSSWELEAVNRGTIYGDEGYIEIINFWKNKEAYVVKNGIKEKIEVNMDSDFTGEIEHAIYCIENNLLESPILGEEGSLQIIKVLE